MTDHSIEPILTDAVNNVLETMFFSAPLGPGEPETGTAVLRARVAFHGHPRGILSLCLSDPGARVLAADFLGEDQETLADSAPGQVVCELANMICGTLVSNMESARIFDLDAPELIGVEGANLAAPDLPCRVQQTFQLDCGVLTVTLQLERTA